MPAAIPAKTGGAQPCPGPPAHHSALVELDAEPSSARRARAWARRVLREWRLDGQLDDAEALIAELAANAVAASAALSRPVIGVALTFAAGELAVLVSDGGPGLPQEQSPAGDAESGRGLLIVTALSSRHGWYALEGGSAAKVVWAVLPGPAAASTPGSPPEAPAWPGSVQQGPRCRPLAAACKASSPGFPSPERQRHDAADGLRQLQPGARRLRRQAGAAGMPSPVPVIPALRNARNSEAVNHVRLSPSSVTNLDAPFLPR
jgi:anti-sigma regulatory factor (Ser/Thr protein kinase)